MPHKFESVSLDDLHDRLGFDPSYEMDDDPDGPFDEWTPAQRDLAEALLARGITASHITSAVHSGITVADLIGTDRTTNPKETTMTTDTQYDSGTQSDDDTTLAEQIEAVGVETVAANIAAATGVSVQQDQEQERVFDPDAYGFIPVLDLFDDDEIEHVLVPMCQKTKGGEPNPLYVTQVWLDNEFGLERLYVARFPSTDPADHLGQPVVLYTQQHEDDESGFVQNLPIAFLKVMTVKAGRDFAQQFRPAPSAEEVERLESARTSAADKIRALANRQF